MRYLGIDYGEKHIGLSLGDDESRLALPIETLTHENLERLAQELEKIIVREQIGAVVVGVPAMGGVFHAQRTAIEKAIEFFRSRLSVSVYAADESFTSRQADRLLRDAGAVPGTDEHAVAAMLILQGFLDSR